MRLKRSPFLTNRGTALTELCVSLPLLTYLLLGILDISNLINHYLVLTQNVGEAARFGAAVPGLETGESCREFAIPATCTPSESVQNGTVLDRLKELVDASKLTYITNVTYKTRYETAASAPSGIQPDVVYVDLGATYQGVIPPFRNLRFSVRSRSAYLY